MIIIVFMLLPSIVAADDDSFDINELGNYQKIYETEEVEVCAVGRAKTYESYTMITDPSSRQYRYIRDHMDVDPTTGLLLDEDGFIGAALGSYFGAIGTRYYFTLDSSVVIPVVKIDEKADAHTVDGCYQYQDHSVIEFVIDTTVAAKYFGHISNEYILDGNFNNFELFNGDIVKIELVTDQERDDLIIYEKEEQYFDYLDVYSEMSTY